MASTRERFLGACKSLNGYQLGGSMPLPFGSVISWYRENGNLQWASGKAAFSKWVCHPDLLFARRIGGISQRDQRPRVKRMASELFGRPGDLQAMPFQYIELGSARKQIGFQPWCDGLWVCRSSGVSARHATVGSPKTRHIQASMEVDATCM